ncbi:hypothetical protein N7495_003126 [Penicillium taxi]|uniref:uncharacterized protein n=1 Tax=Penicillium taxi TaxID=168475 RepID=UPI00254502E6|nr:uncharacterized protein N7495_003126 [Penicillium taxi]KAJ5902598.1 hypothetical protein N7495_003126 [Penicillium taxi]
MLSFPGRVKFRSLPSQETIPQNDIHEDLDSDNPSSSHDSQSKDHTIGVTSYDEAPPATPLKNGSRRWLALCISLIATIPFFCLVWAAVGLKDRRVGENGWNSIQIAMKVEVTLFPLVFAAIVGRLSRKLAHLELQRGASVGTLQRLMGSTTVFGTFYTSWLLRSVDFMGLALFLLWALSPLAAQASLRILSASYEKTYSSPQLNYLDFNATADTTALDSWKWKNDPADELFTTSLVTSKFTNGSTTDLWGNVKVPLLNNLTNNWTEISVNNSVYASQLGVPIIGLLDNGNTSTVLETSYIDIICHDLHGANDKNHSIANMPSMTYVNGTRTSATVSWMSLNFLKGWEGDNALEFTEATCSIALKAIEINVTCSRELDSTRNQGACVANQVKLIGQDSSDLPAIFSTPIIFENFTQSILKAVPQAHEASTTLLDSWMANPNDGPTLYANISLYEMEPELFSQRLTTLVNSFYMARLGYQFMTRTSFNGLQQSSHGNSTSVKSELGPVLFKSIVGNGVVTDSELTLIASPGWITALVLTIFVMVAASIITFFVESATLIPDVLGYVSSLTRDNPHIPLNDTPTMVGGLERTRLLGSIRLRMGDVTSSDEVGTLHVGKISSTERSKSSRKYQ